MSYTTYLFDFDYTLADSSRGIVTCFRNVLNQHGYTDVTDEDILDALPLHNPEWGCKVEDGYILNLKGERLNKYAYNYTIPA